MYNQGMPEPEQSKDWQTATLCRYQRNRMNTGTVIMVPVSNGHGTLRSRPAPRLKEDGPCSTFFPPKPPAVPPKFGSSSSSSGCSSSSSTCSGNGSPPPLPSPFPTSLLDVVRARLNSNQNQDFANGNHSIHNGFATFRPWAKPPKMNAPNEAQHRLSGDFDMQTGVGIPNWNFANSPISANAISSYFAGRQRHNSNDSLSSDGTSMSSSSSSTLSGGPIRPVGVNFRPHREIPWWEIATKKARHRSCPMPTQAHVVAAFEQSLANMTTRLQALTTSAEQKDSELNELRATIDALRAQSAEARLASSVMSSGHPSAITAPSPAFARRHTLTTCKDATGSSEQRMSRQLSTDSMSSINSVSSACSGASAASQRSSETAGKLSRDNSKKKKKGWLRSSFSKAFSRTRNKSRNGSVSDGEDLRHPLRADMSAPNSPLLTSPHNHQANGNGPSMKGSHSSNAIYEKDDEMAPEVVRDLKKQLREKDMVLTDIRLEALTSAHQLESLRETVSKMRNEMLSLRQDNERLQRLVASKSLSSSQTSLPTADSLERRLSLSDACAPSTVDLLLPEMMIDKDGKRVTVGVYLGCHGDHQVFQSLHSEGQTANEIYIGSVSVSGKTKWDVLESLVRRVFKEYILRVDSVSNLGLNAESVHSYSIGDIIMGKESDLPELLPCGYLVGDNMHVRITVKGSQQSSVDGLSFETLVPKSIIQRYISLLTEHRRIILCGPSGTGKTYLAHKLAEYLVLRSGKAVTPGSIATFSVDHKSAKELRQYLSNLADQCENNANDLPAVIILDNLHHVGSLAEVFNGFLSAKYQKCPYIIGTMNQATCSTTNLQLHHNFRWVLCATHMEPVKGFLGRYLRRRLIDAEVHADCRNPELTTVVDWMPKVWQHLNKFLEMHSSSDVTIGPRLFLSCPMDISGSQVWFTDLWNYSIVPYLLDAVREGLQLYGRRAPWEDPATWVLDTFPWNVPAPGIVQPLGLDPSVSADWPALLRLRPEDVGYEGHPGPSPSHTTKHNGQTNGLGSLPTNNKLPVNGEVEGDPLLNMLMRLQEAASYSSPLSNDIDPINGALSSDELSSESAL